MENNHCYSNDAAALLNNPGISVRKSSAKDEQPKNENSCSNLLVPTKRVKEVPIVFREPNVETGFRVPYQPWSYYFFSVFQVHNECMNVWTHWIAFVIVTLKLISIGKEIDLVTDPYSWPMFAGFLTGSILYLCSSFAHCFQSKSEVAHYFCFMVDYAGIGLYGFGCAQLHFTYSSDDSFYNAVKAFYIPLAMFLGFGSCFACVFAKIKYQRPYPYIRKVIQMVSILSIYACLISPVAHKMWHCAMYEAHCARSLPIHIQQIACFIISGIFYASDIPQKIFPGACDFIGHSHQLFHIFIAMSTYYKMIAVSQDYIDNYSQISGRPSPTLFTAFGPMCIVVGLEIICIVMQIDKVHEKVKRERQLKDD